MVLLRYLVFVLNWVRCIPHIVLFYTHKNRGIVRKDVARWLEIGNRHPMKFIYGNRLLGFVYLLSFIKEFRNLFYVRVGIWRYLLYVICKERTTLKIGTSEIGEGLFIQHGVASMIGANSIGKNCSINQQVTITSGVVIKDNVEIRSGAVIIGNLTIGKNSVVGANTTVMKDVPENCTVMPTPSKIVHWNSETISRREPMK